MYNAVYTVEWPLSLPTNRKKTQKRLVRNQVIILHDGSVTLSQHRYTVLEARSRLKTALSS